MFAYLKAIILIADNRYVSPKQLEMRLGKGLHKNC